MHDEQTKILELSYEICFINKFTIFMMFLIYIRVNINVFFAINVCEVGSS